jgi:hypothetical protein
MLRVPSLNLTSAPPEGSWSVGNQFAGISRVSRETSGPSRSPLPRLGSGPHGRGSPEQQRRHPNVSREREQAASTSQPRADPNARSYSILNSQFMHQSLFFVVPAVSISARTSRPAMRQYPSPALGTAGKPAKCASVSPLAPGPGSGLRPRPRPRPRPAWV